MNTGTSLNSTNTSAETAIDVQMPKSHADEQRILAEERIKVMVDNRCQELRDQEFRNDNRALDKAAVTPIHRIFNGLGAGVLALSAAAMSTGMMTSQITAGSIDSVTAGVLVVGLLAIGGGIKFADWREGNKVTAQNHEVDKNGANMALEIGQETSLHGVDPEFGNKLMRRRGYDGIAGGPAVSSSEMAADAQVQRPSPGMGR